jgi:hypothetical protein
MVSYAAQQTGYVTY